MKTFITIWLYFGYAVYWIGWLGSTAIWDISNEVGVGIRVISYIIWFIILVIFIKIDKN